MGIALGTVQFGLNYGIANRSGQIKIGEVKKIIDIATKNNIDTIDTAISYGESEKLLGNVGINDWKIITKLPIIPNGSVNTKKWVKKQISSSLSRLIITHLEGVLLHQTKQLLESGGSQVWSALQELKQDGVINKVGFSIYNPEELDVLQCDYNPDIVQAPYNILDRRLKTSGWLRKLNERGVEVHSRSAFLQGLLLLKKGERPEKFNYWSDLWHLWDSWLEDMGVTALEAALSFVLSEPCISKVIIGIDSLDQLKEILIASDKKVSLYPDGLITKDTNLINPSKWNLL
jgi:aryl-alcohol dehydrogenase-like predicted oxidoreductase